MRIFSPIALLLTSVVLLSGCQDPKPAAPPPAPPVTGAAGGPTGTVPYNPATTPTPQSSTAIPPASSPLAPSPLVVGTAQTAIQSAPADTEDWMGHEWKLFKSSLNTTFSLESHQVHSPKGDLNFTHYQPITFDVSNIDIIDEYKSPMHPPYVEHLLQVSPSDAMHIWVKDRLRSSGDDKTLQIVIKDASVVSSPPPPKSPDDPAPDTHNRRYDARLEVEMRIYSTRIAMSEASISVVATQSANIAEEASIVERKALYRQMMFDLMDSTNAELEKQIFKYFIKYINYAQTP